MRCHAPNPGGGDGVSSGDDSPGRRGIHTPRAARPPLLAVLSRRRVRTMLALPRCRSGWDMPTLPPRGSMVGGRVGLRRIQRLRWSTKLAKKENGGSCGIPAYGVLTMSPSPEHPRRVGERTPYTYHTRLPSAGSCTWSAPGKRPIGSATPPTRADACYNTSSSRSWRRVTSIPCRGSCASFVREAVSPRATSVPSGAPAAPVVLRAQAA